ncbi:hypothetical protein LCGC14_0846570 [marine sediment metagenome]|uniref:Uncharacterized protein n=1 Tax=marine sediment metagenome TaxID=412755 RepID=A0A0F9PGC0_9ZZZZ
MIIQDKEHLKLIDRRKKKMRETIWNRPNFTGVNMYTDASGDNKHRLDHIPRVSPSYETVKNNKTLGEYL